MRELTKSMMSYSWAMSLFGAQQIVNLLTPAGEGDTNGTTVQAFANVTDATTNLLDGSLKEAFKIGDSLQKGMLNFMFGVGLAGGCDPNRWAQAGGDVLKKMTDIGRNITRGSAGTVGFSSGDPATPQSPSGSSASPGRNWGPMPR